MKYTIKQFQTEFPNEDICLDYIFNKKYPDVKQYYRVKGRKCYANPQGKQIHPLAKTIFEKSATPLTLWFYAIYMFSQSKNGVSAKELERQLGVTYKCAWRIAKQIRELMKQDGDMLSGDVEVDETFIGGTRRMSSRLDNKEAVMGMVERKGRIKVKHIADRYNHTLLNEVKANIEQGSNVYTDEWKAYQRLSGLGYKRHSVQHNIKQYVRGLAHTNTIEGFWSQLKRSINGTYHAVSPKYLQSYADEFAFRYSYRKSPSAIFELLMERV